MTTTALLLCAGFGTRLGELTRRQPKPLLDIEGEPLVARTLRHLARDWKLVVAPIREFGRKRRHGSIAGQCSRNQSTVDAAGKQQSNRNIGNKLVVDEEWRRIHDLEQLREYDFLQGDPEFERLTALIREDRALQLQRLQIMRRNGELDPVVAAGE